MGSIVGKAMDDNMKKQQEFMLKNQQLMLERQMAMQNEMRERQMAMMIAKSRDMFHFFGAFYGIAAVGMISAAAKGKKTAAAPLLPLTFVLAYQYDMAYGDKLTRMIEMGERIIDEEHSLLELPHGMPTFASVEAARLKAKQDEPFKPGHDIFL